MPATCSNCGKYRFYAGEKKTISVFIEDSSLLGLVADGSCGVGTQEETKMPSRLSRSSSLSLALPFPLCLSTGKKGRKKTRVLEGFGSQDSLTYFLSKTMLESKLMLDQRASSAVPSSSALTTGRTTGRLMASMAMDRQDHHHGREEAQ